MAPDTTVMPAQAGIPLLAGKAGPQLSLGCRRHL